MNVTTRQILAPAHLNDADQVYFAPHLRGGRFYNPWQVASEGLSGPLDLLKWQLSSNPWKAQKRMENPLRPVKNSLVSFGARQNPKVLWIGHASFLVEMDGFRLLIDPVFGPASRFVPRRAPAPFGVQELPHIDCVLITHGHYDHLDRGSLKALVAAQQAGITLVAPLGLRGAIPPGFEQIIEVDWWTAVDFGGVEVVFVPAQHWHRRGIADTNKALWGGYMIRGSQTLYHSGDTGYFDGFRVIGEVFEDIELAMLPVGAYEPRWFMRPQHMNPQESLKAFDQLGAAQFIAMHWGVFDLTDEPLAQGAQRLEELVEEQARDQARYHILRPGESLST